MEQRTGRGYSFMMGKNQKNSQSSTFDPGIGISLIHKKFEIYQKITRIQKLGQRISFSIPRNIQLSYLKGDSFSGVGLHLLTQRPYQTHLNKFETSEQMVRTMFYNIEGTGVLQVITPKLKSLLKALRVSQNKLIYHAKIFSLIIHIILNTQSSRTSLLNLINNHLYTTRNYNSTNHQPEYTI